MVPPGVGVVASRPGEPTVPSSEIGTETLLYFTSTKEARYAVIAATRTCEPHGKKGGTGMGVPAEMCKAKAPASVV